MEIIQTELVRGMKNRKKHIWNLCVLWLGEQFSNLPTHLETSVCWLTAIYRSGDLKWLNGKRSRGTGCRPLVPVKPVYASVFIPLEDTVRQSADAIFIFTHPSSEESRSAVREPCTEQATHSPESADICSI